MLKKISKVAYQLELPPEGRLHPVFHVSCLKRKLGAQVTPLASLPPVNDEGAPQPELELILNRTDMYSNRDIDRSLGVGSMERDGQRRFNMGSILETSRTLHTPCGQGFLKEKGM